MSNKVKHVQFPIASGEVHLWITRLDRYLSPEIVQRCLCTLNEAEKARFARFHFERDRRRFAVSHALVRYALSMHAKIGPTAWRFASGSDSKPHIVSDTDSVALEFSLSHGGHLCACAVTKGTPVGVDVEDCSRSADPSVLRLLAPSERAYVRSFEPAAQATAFYRVWTLKEAYVKALGIGLSVPLHTFAVLPSYDRGACLAVPVVRDTDQWWFWWERTDASHLLAVVTRRVPSGLPQLHRHTVSAQIFG
jgi:4'-phosphopantetheinyl transferase